MSPEPIDLRGKFDREIGQVTSICLSVVPTKLIPFFQITVYRLANNPHSTPVSSWHFLIVGM